MKKIIKLTESDILDITKRIINEYGDGEVDMSSFREYIPLLQKINNSLNMQEIVSWFNQNNVNYIGLNDLEMIIIYISRNS